MTTSVPVDRTTAIGDASVPTFFYGTAWKEDATRDLVEQALEAGFRAIDTANQRRHYHEAGVGEALAAAYARGTVRREDLFLQTKYTFQEGQDHRLPYDPRADTTTQVRQSFESSLVHLGIDALDSYVLHGPTRRAGLGQRDRDAWHAMESLQREGRTRLIGVSNVTAEQLELLWGEAEVKPAFVQNRCYAELGWDADVRAACRARAIRYQGFSLLTANAHHLRAPEVARIATRHGRTIPQVAFRFALQVGMLPLTGTADPGHMKSDLEVYEFALDDDEIALIGG